MVTEEQIQDEMEDIQEEQMEDSEDDRMELSDEMKELYGAPEPEEHFNQHAFLNKAAFQTPNTLKTTFLNPEECGRPDFSVRFLLQMKTISEHYIDPIVIELIKDNPDKKEEIKNAISIYFQKKIQNITDSGMSMEGFSMNLNVMKKIEATRRRVRQASIDNLKNRRKA